MTNKDIEDMKNKIDELLEMVKRKSDENETLKKENKSLKQQNECLKLIFESMSMTERLEDIMRKTGLFSEEEIKAHMKANKMILQDTKIYICKNEIDRDVLIAKLQDHASKTASALMTSRQQFMYWRDCIRH